MLGWAGGSKADEMLGHLRHVAFPAPWVCAHICSYFVSNICTSVKFRRDIRKGVSTNFFMDIAWVWLLVVRSLASCRFPCLCAHSSSIVGLTNYLVSAKSSTLLSLKRLLQFVNFLFQTLTF